MAGKQDNSFAAQLDARIQADLGGQKGAACIRRANELRAQYLQQIDDRGSASVRRHITETILPLVSLYRTMVENGTPAEQARSYVSDHMHVIARQQAEGMQKMARMPFFYAIFRRMCPSFMKKNYPQEGWDMQWQRCDKEEISFECHRCIYVDITTQLECPELCPAFCENDDIVYGSMAPGIVFARTQTLANGGKCCDFRLLNGRRIKD